MSRGALTGTFFARRKLARPTNDPVCTFMRRFLIRVVRAMSRRRDAARTAQSKDFRSLKRRKCKDQRPLAWLTMMFQKVLVRATASRRRKKCPKLCVTPSPHRGKRAVPKKNKIKRLWEAPPGKDLRQENTLKNKTNRQNR